MSCCGLYANTIKTDLGKTGISYIRPGARPTNGISIEIRSKCGLLWFEIWSIIDHNKILDTSRQGNCRDVYKLPLWSTEYVMNKGIANFIEFRIRTKYR